VQAIQNLVASAVPNLRTENVSIIDEDGNLLTSASKESANALGLGVIDDRTRAFQERLRQQVEDIVERIVGENRVRVQVAAELDFNRIVETSEIYDPDSQVARSRQTIEETEQDTESKTEETVSIGNNLPDKDQKEKAAGPSSASSANRIEETINYEISKTQRTRTQEGGTVKRISVAVVIDGKYTTNPDGSQTYTPRSTDELDQIRSLVQSAIGYSQERGDTIEIANLQFAKTPEPDEQVEVAAPLLGLSKDDIMRIGEIVAALVVAVILLLVLRSVLSGSGGTGPASRAQGDMLPGDPQAQLAPPQPGQPAQPGQSQAPIAAGGQSNALPPPEQNDVTAQIDRAQIEGRIKESSIKKVGELIGSHPDESIAIIRSWIQEA